MPAITVDTCKAPRYEDFPKLAKIRADKVFDTARKIKAAIHELQNQLADLGPSIQAKIETGIDDPDVKSILYGDLLITRRAGYTRRSLDKKWAVTKLLAKGVKKSEIDEHTEETVIEGGISLQILGESASSENE